MVGHLPIPARRWAASRNFREFIQPISKQLTKVSGASIVIPVGFYAFWNFHNVSILTGGPLGYSAGKVEMEFAYQLEPSIKMKKGKVRHPPRSGWLDELDRLKGGRPKV